jgi:hypothetical protein
MVCMAAGGQQNKWIVVTSVSQPTYAVEKFARLEGWQVVVIADVETPTDWSMPGVHLLSVAEQLRLPYYQLAAVEQLKVRFISCAIR